MRRIDIYHLKPNGYVWFCTGTDAFTNFTDALAAYSKHAGIPVQQLKACWFDNREKPDNLQYILKGVHDAEGGWFTLYDGQFDLIEQRWMTFADAKALNLISVSPYQASKWQKTAE